jgi:polar amino acid transport system substrate-binding protein
VVPETEEKTMKAFFSVMAILLIASSAQGAEITIAASEYSPYNYVENGKVAGVSAEVMKAVLREAGLEADFTIFPWPRAYRMALNNQTTIIFPIARIPERESLFKWVGTISPCDVYLYKLKTRKDIRIETLEEAKSYRIGCVREDFTLKYLEGKGFNIETVNYLEELNIRMLVNGRLDLTPFTDLAFFHRITEIGLSSDLFEPAYYLDEVSKDFYAAFSKDTPDALVDKVKKALDALKADGRYERIINRYRK